ncbi:MAG: hypothetical protein U0822_18340 [Anaerolineae bacterium]
MPDQKDRVNFEWAVGESDWDHNTEMMDFTPPPPPRVVQGMRRISRRALAAVGAILTVVALLIGWKMWHDAQVGLEHIRQDIQATADMETWAWYNQDTDSLASLISPNASNSWRTRMQYSLNRLRETIGASLGAPQTVLSDPEVHDNTAVVRVRVTLPTGPAATATTLAETRYYERQADGVWRQTSPDGRFWGDTRQASSEHFAISYNTRDHRAVVAALPRLEALYTQLVADLGLKDLPQTPFSIVVLPTLDNTTFRVSDDRRLAVASPELLLSPANLQYDDILVRSIASPLASYLILEANQRQASQRGSALVRSPFALMGVAQWLVATTTKLPMDFQAQTEEQFRAALGDGYRPSLTNNNPGFGVPNGNGPNARQRGFATVQMTGYSLAEFVAERYGRAKVGEMIRVLGSGLPWDETVQQVFGTDIKTFENDWRAFVLQRYGGEPSASAAIP